MPNHCQNYLVLGHKDAREISRAKLAILEGKFFQEFHPCPQDLLETISGFFSGEEQQRDLEAKTKANLEKYGYANWYDWCNANWGTKWDAYDDEIVAERYDSDIAELSLTFDTAWAPPTKFYDELVNQGFEVDAMYHEFGCQFCGRYTDGTEQYIEYNEDSLHDIPDDIDEQFGITDTLAEWDACDEDDESLEDLVTKALNSEYNAFKGYGDDPEFVNKIVEAARKWAIECYQHEEAES